MSPEIWSISPCSCLMAHVSLIAAHGDFGHDGSSDSLTAQPYSFAFPSAWLLSFRVKAKLTGLESYKTKVFCRNLSSTGHGSQGGRGLFLLCIPRAKSSSSDFHRPPLVSFGWGVLQALLL